MCGSPRGTRPTNAGTDLSDADFIITSQSAVGEMGLPAVTSVGVNYPNPFVRSTVIPYGIKADSHVRLDIFDVSGRLVRTLVDQEERAGSRVLNWTALTATAVGWRRASTWSVSLRTARSRHARCGLCVRSNLPDFTG